MPIKFDPIVKNGLFRVDYQSHKKLYEAIDVAEAKYLLIDELDLFPECKSMDEFLEQKDLRETILKSIRVTTVRRPIRVSDRKAAKRRQQKLNMSAG